MQSCSLAAPNWPWINVESARYVGRRFSISSGISFLLPIYSHHTRHTCYPSTVDQLHSRLQSALVLVASRSKVTGPMIVQCTHESPGAGAQTRLLDTSMYLGTPSTGTRYTHAPIHRRPSPRCRPVSSSVSSPHLAPASPCLSLPLPRPLIRPYRGDGSPRPRRQGKQGRAGSETASIPDRQSHSACVFRGVLAGACGSVRRIKHELAGGHACVAPRPSLPFTLPRKVES